MSDNCCFPLNSLVALWPTGVKFIQEVVPGDAVVTFNPSTGTQERGTVGALMTPVRDAMATLWLGNGTTLQVTPDHPLFTRSKGEWKALSPQGAWKYYHVFAQELKVGDELLTLEGEWVRLDSYDIKYEKVDTWSLGDVTPHPNFYAGQASFILAHNRGSDPKPPVFYWPVHDIEGQTWVWSRDGQVYTWGSGYWIQTTWWSTPNADPNQALPDAAKFPARMIMECKGNWYQVSTNGYTWGPIYSYDYTSPYFSLTGITNPSALFPPAGAYLGAAELQLSGLPWPNTGALGTWEATFTATAQDQAGLSYWVVTVGVPQGTAGVFQISLNSVNGLMVGDKIEKISGGSSGSWTVVGVDPHLCMVTTLEEVSDLPLGEHIFWNEESQNTLVLQDPRILLPKAAYPYCVNMEEFRSPLTEDALFGHLATSSSFFTVGDVGPTLTNIKVSEGAHIRTDCSFAIGSPSTGWYPGMGALNIPVENPIYLPGEESTTPYTPPTVGSEHFTPMADWTSQRLTAPTSLMPDENWAINPWSKMRNRTNCDPYRRKGNGIIWVDGVAIQGSFVRDLGGGVIQYVEDGVTKTTAASNVNSWSAAGANMAGPFAVYDYLDMQRIIFTGKSCSTYTWTGTTWSGLRVNAGYPGGGYVQSACPVTQGQIPHGLFCYVVNTSNDNQTAWPWVAADTAGDRIDLYFKGTTNVAPSIVASIAVPSALIGGTLRETPYGVYIVGASAIGEITWVNSVMGITVQYMVDQVNWLFANTLVALNDKQILLFGRRDSGVGANLKTETWMYRLDRHLTASLDKSIIWDEKIQDGCPTTLGAIRDPSKTDRIVGHIGGSLFQVDTQRPWCIERFIPGGMTGIELVEHICQIYSALAIPDAHGTLHIVSRSILDDVLNINVDRVSVIRTLAWADFSSIIRVTSQDGVYNYDCFGQQGGKLLELDSHPLLWSLSSCAAAAQALRSYFGTPRPVQEEEWFWADPNTAPTWETLRLYRKISVNGGPPFRLMSMSQSYVKGTASVLLVGA